MARYFHAPRMHVCVGVCVGAGADLQPRGWVPPQADRTGEARVSVFLSISTRLFAQVPINRGFSDVD